ncbi:aldehyde dehydrogenase family protein, partial [Escherichia coli]|nr:aldehyde dehydrogenase family protein [Escherichia coli]
MTIAQDVKTLLAKLGVAEAAYTGGTMASYSPVTGEKIADIAVHSAADTAKAIEQADAAFREWRLVPAPKR